MESRASRFQPAQVADFLEALYRLDTDDDTWLAEVAEGCRAVYGCEGPTHAVIYDASNLEQFRDLSFYTAGFCEVGNYWVNRGKEFLTPEMIARTYRSTLGAALMEKAMPEMCTLMEGISKAGIRDGLNINGVDPNGMGVHVCVWLKSERDPTPSEMALYRRMAHHMAAAHRCRRRLRNGTPPTTDDVMDSAEAILDARNRVVHASGPAKDGEAIRELQETAKARDRTLGHRSDSAGTLSQWSPLTSARWTLIDHFDRGGVRYIVARENQAPVAAVPGLSERERQVVVYLALGQSTKEIGYMLGISDATVRVLIARAAGKLGVRSRAALLEHAEVRRLRPDVPSATLGAAD